MKKEMVSIIVPVFNAEKYLENTINTILNQSYDNFETIFVDDKSNDNSISIIKKYEKKDKRLKLIENQVNSGAAVSRNNGIKQATGKYICFLDADDLWNKEKLEKQVEFMREKQCAFSFTGYEFADSTGKPNGKKVYIPEKINYKQALRNTTIWTSTVMLDMSQLQKEEIYMPDVRRGQDTATWWKILRTEVQYAYGLNEILAYYRRPKNTLSSNKMKALKRTWFLYRQVEKLPLVPAMYNFCFYCLNAIKRRI